MSKWKRELSPSDKGYGSGWCGELDRCFRQDRKYVAMSRLLETEIGIVEHYCIRNADNSDIPWAEKQRIKNELVGRNRTAIEVFPSEDRLIDEAGMYHLWVLPAEYQLPFGLHDEDVKTKTIDRGKMVW